jgi:hypothetical protein
MPSLFEDPTQWLKRPANDALFARADEAVETALALRIVAAELARFSKDLDQQRREILEDMRDLHWPLQNLYARR